jgi:photosynthetic reaction center cytochrome c subunit
MSFPLRIAAAIFGLIVIAVVLVTTERPPIDGVQHGYRGTAMDEIYNPRMLAAQAASNVIPGGLAPASPNGPKAGAIYKNVKVLGDLSVGQFTRLMATMTNWVSPKAGCTYCHNGANFADDSLYTKVVARRMLQMVQHINADWKTHVAGVGVTCWTCHRGNPVPAYIWYENPGPEAPQGMAETSTGKNLVSKVAGYSSLPYDPFTPFLEHDYQIRDQSTTALPTGDRQSIKQTDWTYALMIHFATSLGVNCTYCHNTRAFSDWSQSPPQRVTAWYGIRMARDLNVNYLDALHNVFPPARLGQLGDSPKLNCQTCHQGAFKPLYGVSMLSNYPELSMVKPASAESASNAQ